MFFCRYLSIGVVIFLKVICLKSFLFVFFILLNNIAFSEVFRFSFSKDERQKIYSIVEEEVYFNGRLSHKSEIINRIIAKVIDVKNENRPSALYSCTFMTSEKANDGKFTWGKEYSTVFWRNDLGYYSIEEKYFMPIVRGIPTFPIEDVKLGDEWEEEASEAYDFSNIFGIEKPVISPFNVKYQYISKEERNEEELHIIKAKYEKKYQVPENIIKAYLKNSKEDIWPVQTSIKSDQRIAWNAKKGNISYYNETFHIHILLNNGNTIEYSGTSFAESTEIKRNEEKINQEKIKEDIENLNLENITIKKTKKGLTISIENIQFAVNSAILEESEKKKLFSIANVLKKYGKGDILVEGHTVFSSTRERQLSLSKERARVVADYLIELKVRDMSHVFIRGLGGDFPIAPNTTEENKARNRRVEITIME